MNELPGSSFERAESTGARPPWEEDGDDEPFDADDAASEEPGWLRDEWRKRRRLEAEAEAIEARLAARPAPAQGTFSADPDEERLNDIDAQLWLLAEPPPGWEEPVEPDHHAAAAVNQPTTPFEDALEARLTAAELRHWRWIEEGRKQTVIATDLAISQPAVAQREKKVRAKVDSIHRDVTGKPYPWPGGPGQPRRVGARRGRL